MYGILEQPFPSLEAINTSVLQTGLQRVQLLKPNISTPTLPSDMLTMEIRAPDVLVPGQETTYWCYISELPDGFARHHIVMVCRGSGAQVLYQLCLPPGASVTRLGPGELSMVLVERGALL